MYIISFENKSFTGQDINENLAASNIFFLPVYEYLKIHTNASSNQ